MRLWCNISNNYNKQGGNITIQVMRLWCNIIIIIKVVANLAWCLCVASRCHSAKDLGLRSGASALVNAFDWRCECYSAEFRHDETHHLFNEHHNASGAVALIEKTHSAVGWILGTSCCDHAASLFLLPPHHWVVRYFRKSQGGGPDGEECNSQNSGMDCARVQVLQRVGQAYARC